MSQWETCEIYAITDDLRRVEECSRANLRDDELQGAGNIRTLESSIFMK